MTNDNNINDNSNNTDKNGGDGGSGVFIITYSRLKMLLKFFISSASFRLLSEQKMRKNGWQK